MAKRRPPVPVSASAQAESPGAPPVEESASATVRKPGPGISRRKLRLLIIAVFVIVNVVMAVFLKAVDSSITREKTLLAVDAMHDRGEYAAAARGLEEYARLWPEHGVTYGYYFKAGRYLAAAGRVDEAIEHYKKALAMNNPAKNGIRARIAELLWNKGDKQAALKYFEDELRIENDQHDLAHLRIGQSLLEQKKYRDAFFHFQAIRDAKPFESELSAARERLQAEVVTPALDEARRLSLQREKESEG